LLTGCAGVCLCVSRPMEWLGAVDGGERGRRRRVGEVVMFQGKSDITKLGFSC
jgi:hypothetical protein